MTEHNYKMTGSGSTTRIADKDLKEKTKSLVQKLGQRDVSIELNIVERKFSGVYTIKTGAIAIGPSNFQCDSAKDWSEVREKAKTTANVKKYDKRFVVDNYMELTDVQLSAANGRQSPAGPTYNSESSLAILLER